LPLVSSSLERDAHKREMLDSYYELRGWDRKTGIPTRAKLEAMGLKFVADELGRLRKL